MATKGERLGFEMVKNPVTIEGGVMKGIATAFSINSNCHVVIMAPDWKQLREAWKHITDNMPPLDETKVLSVMEAMVGLDYAATEPNIGKEVKKAAADDYEEIWILHPESDCAFVRFRKSLTDDLSLQEIGPAVKSTVLECKLLLRSLGWKREDIDQLKIEDPEDDIPF